MLVLTCPPQHGVIEERELHFSVMLQGGPAPRCCHVDVGHVEGNLHRQEGLSRVPNLEEQDDEGQCRLSHLTVGATTVRTKMYLILYLMQICWHYDQWSQLDFPPYFIIMLEHIRT